MKRKRMILGIIIITIGIFCSCASKNKEAETPKTKEGAKTVTDSKGTSQTSGTQSVHVPDTYERTEENVEFHADVICPESAKEGKVGLPGITLQLMDEKKIADEILKDIPIKKRETDELRGEDGSTSTVVYYTGEQEELLDVQSYRASYTTELYRNYQGHSFDLERNAEKYSTEEELEFMPVKDAWTEVSNMFRNMGLEWGEDFYYKHYALDAQTLSEEEYVIDMDGNLDKAAYKPSWTKEDEGYYFCIWQTHNGMKIHCPNVEFINKYADFNAPVQVLVGKDRIDYLSLGRTFVFGQEENTVEIADLDEISETIIKKLSMLITDSVYTTDRMELCYYPCKLHSGEYELRCVWILNIIEKTASGEESAFQMAVDAVSAEEIY